MLSIPLKNVHVCTLHAEVRLIEKIIYLHIVFAWNTKPTSLAKEAISRLEDVLSKAGLHKRYVKIQKDEKLSGKNGNMPTKPSIGGAKARRFLSNHTGKASNIQHSVWTDIIAATQDFEKDGKTRVLKVDVWKKLDSMIAILRKEKYSDIDKKAVQRTCVEFVNAVSKAWGEDHITHYMVSIKFSKCFQSFIYL